MRGLAVLLLLGAAGAASGGETAIDAARRDAAAAIARRDPVAAEEGLRAAITRSHADDALRAWLAEALLLQGDRAAARRTLDAGPATPDSAALAWKIRGQIALADGDLGRAAGSFDRALGIDANDADLWVSIAALRFTGGEEAPAVAAADRAVAIDPRNPRALALRGLLIREQFGLAAALPWFEAALRVHPDDPALLDAYGSTLGDMGQYRAMLIVARKLAEVDPRSQRPRLMEAVLAARAGQADLARTILQRAGAAFRAMPAAMLLTGALEYQAGNVDLAIEALEQLVQMQPDNLTARHMLARALARNHAWRRLVDLFDGDVAAGRAGPDLIMLVGMAWTQLGGTAAQAKGKMLMARAHAVVAPDGAAGGAAGAAAALASPGSVPVLAARYADNPRRAAPAVAYIRALIAAHQADAAQPIADALRDQNDGNAAANMLAGDVRMIRRDARMALVDYTNAAAIRFNEAVLVRMDASLRAAQRAGDADAMTSRYLAQNPQSAVAMMLLAVGWASNPARSRDLIVLRKAMLARGVALPRSALDATGKPG